MKKEVLIIAGIVVILYLFSKKKKNNMPEETINENKEELTDVLLFNKMMKDAGIKNRFARWAIMCIIGKESGFKPIIERCYNNTSAFRIKKIFVSRLSGKNDAFIDQLKKDCKAFFNYVYGYAGNKLGNLPGTDDGYNYRGRGLNQLTGRGNYEHFGDKLGLDLINNPELVNVSPNYFAIAILFFIETANSNAGKSTLKNRLGISSINDFTDIDGAIHFFANANAGIGYSWNANNVLNAVIQANKNKTKYKLLSL